jgi:hypothetical protein
MDVQPAQSSRPYVNQEQVVSANRVLVSALALLFASHLNAQDVDGAKVLDGLGATDDDIAQLEGGEIIAYSDEAYESTPRELSADAVMLIDIDEVEELFKLKSGKDFNLSAAEFELLQNRLSPHRSGSTSDKVTAASDAMREILIGRYTKYQAEGLKGIESYWLPYDENTYMGLAMSASADILDSMMGKMLRPLGRNKAQDLVTDVMTEVRSDLEE